MSLNHTADLGGVNPFDYLTELLCHAPQVREDAEAWLPWNYHRALPPKA